MDITTELYLFAGGLLFLSWAVGYTIVRFWRFSVPVILAMILCAGASFAFAKPSLESAGRLNHIIEGTEAKFNPESPYVHITVPPNVSNPPVMIYGHGGAGYRHSDKARVKMFQERGFVTIAFDAFLMNGFTDYIWVNRNITNHGKQLMVLTIMRGAYKYALSQEWDTRNIFLYGQSNGARAAIILPSKVNNIRPIRGVILEGMAGSGMWLPSDVSVPVRLFYGDMDTWGGEHDRDYIWKRSRNYSPVSVQEWFEDHEKKIDIRMIFYKNAGHSFHYGPLTERTRRIKGFQTTSYLGADERIIKQYVKDVFEFVNSKMVR